MQKNTVRLENVIRIWIIGGFFLYLASLYFLDTKQQNTIFYLAIALPGLFLVGRWTELFSAGGKGTAWILGFVLYVGTSALWSGLGIDALLDALKYGFYVVCLMLAVHVLISTRQGYEDEVQRFFVLAALCASFLYIFTAFRSGINVQSLLAGRYSLRDLSGWGEDNPISSAVFFGVPVLAAWWRFPHEKAPVLFALALVVATSVGIIFVTKSRGPFLALGATLTLLALSRRSRTDFLLLAACAAAGLVLLFALGLQPVIADRATAPNYRLEIWASSVQSMSEHLVLGSGFGREAALTFGEKYIATHSHSSVLEVFRVGGLVGGALFLAMLFVVVRGSVAEKGVDFFLCWLVYGLLCLSTNGRMLLGRPSVEWFAFWIPLCFLLFVRPAPAKSASASGKAESMQVKVHT